MNIEHLKSARKNSGMTQQEVADAIGIVQSAYKNYEQGNREPKGDTIVTLANLFNVTTDYLLGRETGKPETPLHTFAKTANLKELEEILIKEYLELNNKQREAVLDFLRRCTEKEAARKCTSKSNSQRITITAGELEDQWKAEQEAKNKDVG